MTRFFLACLVLAFMVSASRASVQAESKINYKVIPHLEAMKQKALTPDFTVLNTNGKKISLKDFRGKLVLLNFWASWCEPCREEMPAMERLYEEFKDQNFVVFAVSVKDRKQDSIDFAKALKLSYPVAMDPEGHAGLLYGAWALPTTYLIGPKGEGLARVWGPADWYSPGARRLIKELLDGKR